MLRNFNLTCLIRCFLVCRDVSIKYVSGLKMSFEYWDYLLVYTLVVRNLAF
ncbi:hypothetical protein Poly24_43560 [Rosistilla carotiformis]|uniref:Uncharacterized protein n=1 Tax=Rosistilla carotiformis TaxID=2528017 RepID=A0A518JYL2_9BACT|nr:hypothetical protein Poly24_43560 [Rosistilla carotiformis]